MSPEEFYREAVEAVRFARDAGAKIIINDRVDIALVTKADGVHLGQDDLPPERAKKSWVRKRSSVFRRTTLSKPFKLQKCPSITSQPAPFFVTLTKDKPDPTIELGGLRTVSEAVREIPLVAIGGITAENAQSALVAGADSVAVISYLITDPEQISLRMKELGQIASHNIVCNR